MLNNRHILVTGGAGFIASHLVDMLLKNNANVIVLDALTYAGNLQNLANARLHRNFKFVQGDICDPLTVAELLNAYNIDLVFHLAAESHVDNSLTNPRAFIDTNITGTYNMLFACLKFWEANSKPEQFRFIHISTDEVFGQLSLTDVAFDENSPYKPNSPYSASKAASDLLVRAWHHSYKFPAIITNASNNFGPRQHGEKLIPTVIRNALARRKIPIYGNGTNIRDWLFVQDFCRGLISAAKYGEVGENYCFGGNMELNNLELATKICKLLDNLYPGEQPYSSYISYVEDRKGHDFRYAVDPTKAKATLGWRLETNFDNNLLQTIKSYGEVFVTQEELSVPYS